MKLKLRPLERKVLSFIHDLDNERHAMAFWFEEPYESLDELFNLYDKHIHDDSERRFVIDIDEQFAGIVELMDINFIHRTAEIQIIVKSDFRGQGLSKNAMLRGLDYAFNILNMHKVYLFVDAENHKALHLYKDIGFVQEGILRQHFFVEGMYRDSIFMGILKSEIQAGLKQFKTAAAGVI
jgi:diamine N-acetyltransferase